MQYMILKVPLHTTKQPVCALPQDPGKNNPRVRTCGDSGITTGTVRYVLLSSSTEGSGIIRDKPGDLCVQRGPVDMGEKKMRHFFLDETVTRL